MTKWKVQSLRIKMPRISLKLSLSGLLLALAIQLMTASHQAIAQRLPQTVKPEHYTLKLTPDLKTATFTGQETIDIVLNEPLSVITLNSAEIKFVAVTTQLNGKTLTAKVTEAPGKQQATLD